MSPEKPRDLDVLDAALAVLAKPAVWIGFAFVLAGALYALVAAARGGSAEGPRFDYDLF